MILKVMIQNDSSRKLIFMKNFEAVSKTFNLWKFNKISLQKNIWNLNNQKNFYTRL